MTNEQMTLETCRYCETALVGAERNACDPCLDAICPACKDCFPDVDGQLCPDCFDN